MVGVWWKLKASLPPLDRVVPARLNFWLLIFWSVVILTPIRVMQLTL